MKVISQIGRGAFGAVYEVFDRERSDTVALKLLRDIHPAWIHRFKQEFRLLSYIEHDNLIRLFELFQEHNSYFFTMELVRGVDFVTYIRGRSGECFDEGRVRTALKQLAQATHALHQVELLHRDLKPQNVLVTYSGALKVLDFGLVKSLQPDDTAPQTIVAGTPYYMAPEQCSGGELTAAADWYAIGAMLYESLTGAPPFGGPARGILQRKQLDRPLPPRQVAPDIPADLNDLCIALLCPNPLDRPSGEEVLRRLGPQTLESAGIHRPLPESFVGRSAILNELHEMVVAANAGKLKSVSISGPSGTGKTALLTAFASRVRQNWHDAVILRGRCHENTSVPYKAIDELVDQLSRKLASMHSETVASILPRDAEFLSRLFPVFGQVEEIRRRSERKTPEIADAHEFRRRSFTALAEMLARIGERFPLVAIIDDLQWGDLDSAPFFEQLLTGPVVPAMLFMVAYRAEDADTSPFVASYRNIIEHSGIRALTTTFELGELTREEALELSAQLLDCGRSNQDAEAIASNSGGNPLFIVQLAAAMKSDAERDRLTRAERALSFRDLIHRRLSGLRHDARRVLELLAIAGSALPERLFFLLLKEESDRTAVLRVLVSERLVRVRETPATRQVEVYHQRIRASIIESLDETERCRLHRELAEALENDGDTDPAFVAYHFEHAGLNERAVDYALAAGQRAAEKLAFDRAAQCYRSCLELKSSGGAERHGILLKLADALVNAGRGIDAANVYLEAARDASCADAVRLRRRAAHQMLRSGDIAQGAAVLKSVGDQFAVNVEPGLLSAVASAVGQKIYVRLRGLEYQERTSPAVDENILDRLETLWSLTAALTVMSPVLAASFQFRHLRLALRTGERTHVGLALAMEAARTAAAGERSLSQANRILAGAFELAKRANSDHLLGFATTMSALVAWLTGQWRLAAEASRAAEQIFVERCTGVAWELGTARLLHAGALMWLGEWREMSSSVAFYVNDARKRNDMYTRAYLELNWWITHLAANDVDAAQSALDSGERFIEERWSPRGFHQAHMQALIGRAHTMLYEGRAREASTYLESHWRPMARSFLLRMPTLYVLAFYTRAICSIAAAAESHERNEMIRLAKDSSDRLRRGPAPWAAGMALLIEGSIAAVDGNRERAAALYEKAEAAMANHQLGIFAAVARYRHGQFLAGTRGESLMTDAESVMTLHGVRRPDRIAAMLAPSPRA